MPDGSLVPSETQRPSARMRRDADLLGRRDSQARKWLARKIDTIVRGFEDQAARSDDLDNWWNIFNCVLDDNQYYNGNAQVYVPIVRDAINALVTRHSNQLFPQSGRFIDCRSTDGSMPVEIMSLVNHYIKEAQFETQSVKPLLRNGYIEGQFNLYVDWLEIRRQIVSRETRGVIDPATGSELPGHSVHDIAEEDLIEGRPGFQVLHDSDVLVWPPTVDTIEQAFAAGGGCCIVRRYSKETIKRLQDADIIDPKGEDDEGNATVSGDTLAGLNDLARKLAKAVGIRGKGSHTLLFETWMMVPLGKEGSFSEKGEKRLCQWWWDIEREPRGLKRNPYWNDRCPLLSAPVEKTAGVFKGKSLIEAVAPLQYEANDAANERADVDHYSAMPIIRRTPGEGNSPFILNLAAVWDAPPGGVEFLSFPDLSARANARIMAAMALVMQSLSVNPSMMAQQTGRPGAKRNQAEIAMEQQAELLMASEAVKVPEQAILTPTVQWIVDLDHQFRDRDLTVRRYGEMAHYAELIDVPVMRNRAQYWFEWCGGEQTRRNIAMQQGGIALLNVTRGLLPQLQAEGFITKIGPAIQQAYIDVWGPQIGSQMLIDARHQQTMGQEQENEILAYGEEVPVHPLDDDQKHIPLTMKFIQETGDPKGIGRLHLQLHLQQMKMKAMASVMQAAQAQMAQPQQQGQIAGPAQPQPGAQPANVRQLRGPPGMVRPDNLPAAGALTMPRKM